MLQFRVFVYAEHRRATPCSPVELRDQSSSFSEPFSHLLTPPSTLFLSETPSHTYTTAASQPFAYQSLPYSFQHDGGCTHSLFRLTTFPPACELSSSPSNSCALFCKILYFFALNKNSTLLFSIDSALFAKKRQAAVPIHALLPLILAGGARLGVN